MFTNKAAGASPEWTQKEGKAYLTTKSAVLTEESKEGDNGVKVGDEWTFQVHKWEMWANGATNSDWTYSSGPAVPFKVL